MSDHPLALKRAEIGYSQNDVAKILKISRQAVNEIEHGRMKPSCCVLLDMILMFHIEPLYLHLYYRQFEK